MHKFRITWLTSPTLVSRNHERVFLDCISSTFNVKLESTFFTTNSLMVPWNCSFAECTWVLHRAWVRMNTVEWHFITSISVWAVIDYTTKKLFLFLQLVIISQFLVNVERLTSHTRRKMTRSRSNQIRRPALNENVAIYMFFQPLEKSWGGGRGEG